MKSILYLLLFAYAWRLNEPQLARALRIYAYAGCLYSIWEEGAPSWSPGSAGSLLRWGAVGSGFGCLPQADWGEPGRLYVEHVSGYCARWLWQGRQPSVWFSQIKARSLGIALSTFFSLGNWNPRFRSTWTSEQRLLIMYGVSSFSPPKIPALDIMAIVKIRHKS